MPWYMSIIVFIMVVLSYVTMNYQDIAINESTRFWALIVTGVWAICSITHHYWKKIFPNDV